MRRFTEFAFTPSVKAKQTEYGSRAAMARLERHPDPRGAITPDLAAFIRSRRSFYLATASADGQPYIQHRGGPPGFLRVLSPHVLTFADFTGNRQFITEGNLAENPRAMLFLMDYAQARRIKIWGQARISHEPHLLQDAPLPDGEAPARLLTGRSMLFHVDAWDENCPRFIPRLHDTGDAET